MRRKMKRKAFHFDSRGMTLVEVIIALGIMSIMSMAMMSLMQSQARETRALTEKMAALDFQRTVEGAISVAASCGKNVSVGNLASGSSLTFNPASITSTNKNKPQVIANLKDVYGMDGATVLIDTTSANRVVSALSNNVKIRANNGLQLGAYKDPTSGQLVYQLLLAFDGSTLTRPIHNLAMTINATTLPAGGSSIQVTGCIGASAPAPIPPPTVPSGTWCGAFEDSSGGSAYIYYGQIIFPANSYVTRIISACQGQTPAAQQGPISVVYAKSSLCPSGYTLTEVGLSKMNTNPGYYDPEGGSMPVSYSANTLLTCVKTQ